MDSSLERIRTKISDLEAKIADLRLVERELLALDKVPTPKPKAVAVAAAKPRARRKLMTAAAPSSGPRKTIGVAITEVLGQHGALPVGEIADHIIASGRNINRRTISYSLQAMKKQGLVKADDGKWALAKARAAAARA